MIWNNNNKGTNNENTRAKLYVTGIFLEENLYNSNYYFLCSGIFFSKSHHSLCSFASSTILSFFIKLMVKCLHLNGKDLTWCVFDLLYVYVRARFFLFFFLFLMLLSPDFIVFISIFSAFFCFILFYFSFLIRLLPIQCVYA